MPATPVANGEHAAEKAAQEAAKAAAIAEEARVADERQRGSAALEAVQPDLLTAASDYTEADTARNAAQLVLGYRILDVERILVEHPSLDRTIQGYCEDVLPDLSGPGLFSSSPAYRALQAARVASVIKAPVGDTAVDALRKLHRVKDVDGAATAVFKAAKAATKRGKRVSGAAIEAALEDLYPKAETAASTPGPKTKTAEEKAARNTVAEDEKKAATEVPDLVVSAARLGSAATLVGKTFADCTEEGLPFAKAVALSILTSCEKYGTAATRIALEGHKAEKAAPKTAAKKRQPKTTKTTS